MHQRARLLIRRDATQSSCHNDERSSARRRRVCDRAATSASSAASAGIVESLRFPPLPPCSLARWRWSQRGRRSLRSTLSALMWRAADVLGMRWSDGARGFPSPPPPLTPPKTFAIELDRSVSDGGGKPAVICLPADGGFARWRH